MRPPLIPAHLQPGVGPGDFWRQGRQTVKLLEHVAGLTSSECVLDVGCGLGRVAWPLADKLDEPSTYDGFDNCAAYVEHCRTALGLDPERFRFHHFDVYSSFYNPSGTMSAAELVFPWADGTFSLAIATSLFTHLTYADTSHYLSEIGRTLRVGGRLYATFFVIDDDSQKLIRTTTTDPSFVVPFEHGLLADAARPELAVAFHAGALLEAFRSAGFNIDAYHPGMWRQAAGAEYQDIVVARRE